MKTTEARKTGWVTDADLKRTLRIIDDPSKTPKEKMGWLKTPGAIPGSAQRWIACLIARRTPIPGEDAMVDLHGKDPLAMEAMRVAELHAVGYVGDAELEGIRERIRATAEGGKPVSHSRLRKSISGMSRGAAFACVDADPALALGKAARLARGVARNVEMLRVAKRIGGAATDEQVEEAYVRVDAVSEKMLEAQVALARQVVVALLGG